jgi:hypothetical protein
MQQQESLGKGGVVLVISNKNHLRRFLCGDGKECRGLNGGKKMLGDIRSISRKDWKEIREDIMRYNIMLQEPIVIMTEERVGSNIRTYFHTNPIYEIEANITDIIIRKRMVMEG